jgi:hypothetical protein
MSAKAITEYDGKRLLSKWLLEPPSFQAMSINTSAASSTSFIPSTRLAQVSLLLYTALFHYQPHILSFLPSFNF